MSTVLLIGSDPHLLERWDTVARTAGHRVVRHAPADAGVCLFDLGPRGGAPHQVLLDLMAASPALACVAMTARPDAGEGLQLLRSGARGYCNRLAADAVVGTLLTSVDNDEIWAGREVTDHLLQAALRRPPPSVDVAAEALFALLTERERAIAVQVAAGLSNKVIAADSGISERTVKAHLNSIFRKTGIRNRVQLALAVSSGRGSAHRQLTG